MRFLHNHDLVSPDGVITSIKKQNEETYESIVSIKSISPKFVGYDIETSLISFNLKSTLGQLGITSSLLECELDQNNNAATVKILLHGLNKLGCAMLKHLDVNVHVGRLFAADDRRLIRDPSYVSKMFTRTDRAGRPLLSFGDDKSNKEWILEKIDGRAIAFLSLKHGVVKYDAQINSFLPTIARALKRNDSIRHLLSLHQTIDLKHPRSVKEKELLIVKTAPLHIRTFFGIVVNDLLAKGFHHTTANVLQPDTHASGDIYELYGESDSEITDIPMEFYTLEPHRAHIFFSDKYKLQSNLNDPKILFKAFSSAPKPQNTPAATFVSENAQLQNLKPKDWITGEMKYSYFPGITQGPGRQAHIVQEYIKKQPTYPFLNKINNDTINSQGVLLSRYFPSTTMKPILLNINVLKRLKGIYFEYPSQTHGDYFAQEDRALLNDLTTFSIPVFWCDPTSKKILQYTQKTELKNGLFVPIKDVTAFIKSTTFGVYGSNLLEGNFEQELQKLLQGVLDMREKSSHHLLLEDTPLCLITGGGPGAMEVGNRVAKKLNILSCANVLDFQDKSKQIVNEQKQNPYIEGKMTYRLHELIERQAEFHLDFPIFLTGGIGTDFEFSLEEVRRKVGTVHPLTPILLFGSKEYWTSKITPNFQCNLKSGTIKGSEWVSNCFYCIQTAKQGLQVYKQFFEGTLPIGPNHSYNKSGFITIK